MERDREKPARRPPGDHRAAASCVSVRPFLRSFFTKFLLSALPMELSQHESLRRRQMDGSAVIILGQ